MKELSNFLIENTVEFKPLMSNVPVPLIKKWVKEYKESGTKKEFEDWVDEHAWMLVDAGYTKIKNYSIFLLDPKDSSSIFGTQEQIGEEINSEFVVNYFDPVFKSIFLFPDGKYNEKALKEWAKSYNSLWRRREFYANLIENREKFEEPEFTTMFRILFIQSLGVEILNYFDLTDTMPMSLEDAEFMMKIIEKAKTPEVAGKLGYRPDLRIVSPWLDQFSLMIWKLDKDYLYGTEEKALVKQGIEAIQTVLLGKDSSAKRRLLFYLDQYLDPFYQNDLSELNEPLKALLQEVMNSDNEDDVIEEAHHLLEAYMEIE